jgi:hypothetical protein
MNKIQDLIVNMVLHFYQRVPGPVIHNLDKASMLKRVFWHLNVDQLAGDYVEFGVARGYSIKAAVLASKYAFSRAIGVRYMSRSFYGFDTFEGFSSNSNFDSHPTWNGKLFNDTKESIERRFKRFPNVHFYKQDALELTDPRRGITSHASFGIKGNLAVVLFDMDLYGPTISALEWVYPLLQQGTFLIFDEPFAFKGDNSKGEARAISEFLAMHPEISFEIFGYYGSGGKVVVVSISVI